MTESNRHIQAVPEKAEPSVFLDPKPEPEDAVAWAMDICQDVNHPYYGNPIAAHQIVRVEGEPGLKEIRITACGKRLDRFNHPRGWWTTRPGELPLADHAVHCMAAAEPETTLVDTGSMFVRVPKEQS